MCVCGGGGGEGADDHVKGGQKQSPSQESLRHAVDRPCKLEERHKRLGGKVLHVDGTAPPDALGAMDVLEVSVLEGHSIELREGEGWEMKGGGRVEGAVDSEVWPRPTYVALVGVEGVRGPRLMLRGHNVEMGRQH